jgi:prepilin-type N-terminal cleavage/methylation domain-containing protein
MTFCIPPKSRSFGFTLVEMAMVLLIIGLILGGLLPTISTQQEQQRINETRKELSEIQQALIGFAVINGRLPCPAQASLASDQPNAGMETSKGNTCGCLSASGSNDTVANAGASNVACTNTSVTGVIPWVTLGIRETDAWDHRFTYRVATRFADQIAAGTTDCAPALSTPPLASSFALCSPGVPDVVSAASGGVAVATDVPGIVVSHGKNGLGAYRSDGSQIPGATGDEAENSDNNNTFVDHSYASSYDDLVTWISQNVLMNRMVTAGKLP